MATIQSLLLDSHSMFSYSLNILVNYVLLHCTSEPHATSEEDASVMLAGKEQRAKSNEYDTYVSIICGLHCHMLYVS